MVNRIVRGSRAFPATPPPILSGRPDLRREIDGLVNPRVIFALDRVPRGLPVRLTVVVGPAAKREEIDQALLSNPLWRVEERAPQVWDVELPNVKFEALLEHRRLFRKIDLGGRVHGVRVPAGDDRAVVRIALVEPLTSEQRRELMRIGLRITREGDGDVSGEAPGRAVAQFVAIDWLGPIEVRRVALAEK